MEADGLCRGSLPSVYKSRSEWALFHIDLRSLMSKEANNKGSFSKKLDMCCLWFYVSNLSLLCCWSTPLIDLDNDARPASAACVGPNYYMKKKAKKKKKETRRRKKKRWCPLLFSSSSSASLLFSPPLPSLPSFELLWHRDLARSRGPGRGESLAAMASKPEAKKQRAMPCQAKDSASQPAHCAGSAAVAVAVAAEL